ncbi:unnamed protein product, partial [Mesorhabditis belari]|uniref:Rab-GAP TBC domain-containing protein n=1 Tax=Mesorhabditis belari TaxID=2138241 RepID=A0AAF3JB51_9BILA
MVLKRKRVSFASETDFVNKRDGNLHIKATRSPRKYSCNDQKDDQSERSTFALSVLEEKLRRIGAFSPQHRWTDTGSTGTGESECTTTEETPPTMTTAPVWLDEWVHKWLQQQQPFLDENTRQHISPPNSLASSNETSLYNSHDGSSATSELVENDELNKLRVIDNRQKERIYQLNCEKKLLSEQIDELKKKTLEATAEGRQLLQNQNKFLNGEVLRLNKRNNELETRLRNTAGSLAQVKEELERYKREYVFCLQSCIRIPLHDNNSLDIVQVKLYGGDVHRKRVSELLAAAREEEPSLPTFQSVQTGTYVDCYGFRHHYPDPSLTVHYVATQLHLHYSERLESSKEHRRRWKAFLESHPTIPICKESKQLVRAGIPNGMRSSVWKILINQQVLDMKVQYGKYYYRNLCSLQGGEAERMFCNHHQKQINLDLLRTMPNNVHFMSANCKGVSQLQQVLRAFCLHNGSLGYCQGMNFLAATALLFVGPEDAFWFLIALTEKFFDKSYFDESLAGAQADQEVLKELLEVKFPRIQQHLDQCEIELATVTLNWFIALFFDAVPFQTLLRIWDCFLLEGPKVLFRFSVALLGMNEAEILQKNDTIGIMKIVKAAVRLTYDIDGLFTLAFCDLNPFPARAQLNTKQRTFLALLQEKLSRRQQRRDVLTSTCDSAYASSTTEPNDTPISDLAMSPFNDGFGFVVAGNQHIGFIGKLVLDPILNRVHRLDIEFDCRVVSLVIVRQEMAFASLISGYIVALHIEGTECSILWELKLSDVALKLLHDDTRIIAVLANGTITILENVIEKAPTSLELLHVPVGSAPIGEAAIVGDLLFLAVACRIVVLNRESLSHLSSIYVACSASGSGTPFFEKIVCLCPSPYGAFVVTANSTLVQLWTESAQCGLLFDVAFDHSNRKPSLDNFGDEEQSIHISALAHLDGLLWVGTSDGYVIMYQMEQASCETKYRVHRYPAGRRIHPRNSPGGDKEGGRGALCYIPTREETRMDEATERLESPNRIPRRVSVMIDKDTQKYSVLVAKMRSKSFNQKSTLPQRKPRLNSSSKPQLLTKEISHDSAVSVFSNGDCDIETQKRAEIEQRKVEREKILRVLRASTGSSSISMDYDDQVELYSEDGFGKRIRRLSVPSSRSLHKEVLDINRNSTNDNSTSRLPKLRRKDLTFDDPLVVAIQETDESAPSTSASPKSESETNVDPVVSCVSLTLTMKLKISDRPVRKMIPTRYLGREAMITCSGNYGDEEALLKWYKEQESGLWINDPIVDSLANRRYSVFSSTPSSPRNAGLPS